jgi:hypothetical protein
MSSCEIPLFINIVLGLFLPPLTMSTLAIVSKNILWFKMRVWELERLSWFDVRAFGSERMGLRFSYLFAVEC